MFQGKPLSLLLLISLFFFLGCCCVELAWASDDANVLGDAADTADQPAPVPPQTEFRKTVRTASAFRATAGPWFCQADTRTELLPERVGRDDEDSDRDRRMRNERVLSRLGVPFIFDTHDSDALLCFRHILLFRDSQSGLCPQVSYVEDGHPTALRPYYYAFHPSELEERYGAATLAAFALVEKPWQWDAVDMHSFAVGATLREAERYIASLPDPPNGLGVVQLRVPQEWGIAGGGGLGREDMDIHLFDILLTVAPDGSGMPLIQFDAESASRRVFRRRRVRAKLKYAELIDQHDNAIRQEVRNVVNAIQEEVGKAQRGYVTERRRRESYENFVVAQQQQRERERRESRRGSLASSTSRHEEDNRKSHRRERELRCYKLNKALDTLIAQKASQGGRMAGIRALLEKHNCRRLLDTPAQEEEERRGLGDTTAPLREEALCRLYLDGVADLQAWRDYTGQRPSVSQGFSLLLTLYMNATLGTDDPSHGEAMDDDSSSSSSRIDMGRFTTWVHKHFTVSLFDTCGSTTTTVPEDIRAELLFTSGLMDLLFCHDGSRCDGAGNAIARGITTLHQAMWLHSSQATAALATLRELGLYMHQNLKASQVLLTTSMREVPGKLYRELWKELQEKRKRKPRASAGGTAATAMRGARTMEGKVAAARRAERVLRSERMYGSPHSWSQVDNPFAVREFVLLFFAVEDTHYEGVDEDSGDGIGGKPPPESVLQEEEQDSEDDEDGEDGASATTQGPFAARVANQLAKAGFLSHGFHVERNIHAAECQLLSILRKFEYLCDVHLLMDIAHRRTGKGSRRSRASQDGARNVLKSMKAVCPAHEEELSALMGRSRHKRFRCPWANTTEGAQRRGAPFPAVEENFNVLREALTTLGYVYIAMGDYARAAMYARLSLQLTASVFHHATQPRFWQPPLLPPGMLRRHTSRYHELGAQAYKKQRARRSPPWATWWMRKLLASFIEFDEERLHMLDSPPGSTVRWLAENDTFPLALVDSNFIVGEELVLLAMAVLLDEAPAAGAEASGATVAMLSAEEVIRDAFVNRSHVNLLDALRERSVFTPCQGTVAERSSPPPLSVATPLGRRQQQQQTALFLLLAAASQMLAVKKAGSVIDRTFHSVHVSDPLLLITWLLRDMESTLGTVAEDSAPRQCVSMDAIRQVGESVPGFVGARPFLPFPHDTMDSYVRRLMNKMYRDSHTSDLFIEAFHQGIARVDGHGRGVVNGDTSRRWNFRFLRITQQLAMDRSHFLPLLHASDASAYVTRTHRWTLAERVGDALLNGMYYLFTETTREKLLRHLGLALMPAIPGGRDGGGGSAKATAAGTAADDTVDSGVGTGGTLSPFWVTQRQESPAPFVREYVELFDSLLEVREAGVAVQLVAAALASGLPQGFSLILLEASPGRGNPYLAALADYLAGSVFGPVTASMWLEEHAAAQWQRDKPDVRGHSSVLTLNTHTPFRYTNPEQRQELMARVDVWRARKLLRRGEEVGRRELRQRLLLRSADILSRCSGAVTHAAVARWLHSPRHTVAIPQSPFEGMIFPAADPACAKELLAVLLALGRDGVLPFGGKEASAYLDRVMGHMLTRLALYYHLATRDHLPTRVLPSTTAEFADDPFSTPGSEERGESDGDSEDFFADHDVDGASEEVDYVIPPRKDLRCMVEPWAVWKSAAERERSGPFPPGNGEGAFYFSRLHRITGLRLGARLQSTWHWLKGLLRLSW